MSDQWKYQALVDNRLIIRPDEPLAVLFSDSVSDNPNGWLFSRGSWVADCGSDTCPYEPPCDFHGDGEPEDHDER